MLASRTFRQFLNSDHKTRGYTDLISVGVAFLWCFIEEFGLGATQQNALKHSALVLVCCMAFASFVYAVTMKDTSAPLPEKKARPLAEKRRWAATLVQSAVCLALIASLSLLLPRVEAAIIDRRLDKAIAEGTTESSVRKATTIVEQALKYNLKASPNVIRQVGSRIVNADYNDPAQLQTALNAGSAFASYQSLLARPPVPDVFDVIHHTPAGEFEIIVIGYGQAQEDNVIWEGPGIERPVRSNARQVIVKINRMKGFIDIVDKHIRNIVFEDATIAYKGGPINLEGVQFVRCHFTSEANSPNVRSLLLAVIQGTPVTLQVQ